MNKIKGLSIILSSIVLFSSIIVYITYINVLYPLKFVDEINTAGYIYDVEPAFIASVINEESSFDNLCESPSGAIGLMQIMPSTAEWLAVRMGISDYTVNKLYEPQFNINMGTFYLRYLMDRFDNDYTVLCAYNAGEGIVRNWLSNNAYSVDNQVLITTPYKETNAYAEKVLKNVDRYKTRFESRF